MYCAHCGMELPDWAHFCERCGTRVERPAASEDPIDHVGLDDTSASEPLWPEDAAAAVAESETFEPKVRDLPTLLMNLSAEIAESGDDFSQLADEMVNSQREARPVRIGNRIRKGHGEVRVPDWQAHVSADEAAETAQPAADDAGDRTQLMPEDAAQKTQPMPE
ncbi:MAG: zinc ribbon domain-containing protein, partial [Atopobiaceae bacterium]|nr:zinc ribbon domain-containing protein [Atopobiaceae bacterium]